MQFIRPLFVMSLALLVSACIPEEPLPQDPDPCESAADGVTDAYAGLGQILAGIANQMQSVVTQYEVDDEYSYDEAISDMVQLQNNMTSAAVDAYDDAIAAAESCGDPDIRQEMVDQIVELIALYVQQRDAYINDAHAMLDELADGFDEAEDGPQAPGAAAPPNNNIMDADQTIGDCTNGACIPN